MNKEEISKQIESELAMAVAIPALRALCIQRIKILWDLYRIVEVDPDTLYPPELDGKVAD